eukprot:751651-Hanusia_phi.AAC.2
MAARGQVRSLPPNAALYSSSSTLPGPVANAGLIPSPMIHHRRIHDTSRSSRRFPVTAAAGVPMSTTLISCEITELVSSLCIEKRDSDTSSEAEGPEIV